MGNELNRTLGLADVFCISAGAMISSGIFILPGMAFANIGPAVFLAYLLAGVCALIGMLSTVELTTAMPLAGGVYFFTGRSLGPLAGTVSGLLNWCAIALKSAFAIFGLSEVVYQFCGLNPLLGGVLFTLLFVVVNLIGTKAAAWAQIIMVVILFAALGAYVVLGFPELKPSRFQPFFNGDKTAAALLAEAAFVFVAFGGLLDVASVSEEVKNPRRNLPLGMISAIIAVTVTYVLVLIVTVGVSQPAKLAGSLTPLADAARNYYGKAGFIVITLGALMAFVTTANAGVMAAARFPYAMGRDRLVPAFFSQTYGKRQLPLPALLTTGALMVAVQFLDLSKIVTVASTVIMLSFILTNLAVIILRESGIQNYRPTFRVPWYPYTPLVGMVMFGILIMELGLGSVKMSFAIVIAGVVLYFLYGRRHGGEYALLHLLGRLTRSPRRNHGLESELREIVRGRDDIVCDEFDRLVERAAVHVVSGRNPFPDIVHLVCEEDFKRTIPGVDTLEREFLEREKMSCTAISAEAAVPHLIVNGENICELVLVKSAGGVPFGDAAPEVRILFFLILSPDRRNLHLRALSAIAQIIQSRSFERRLAGVATGEQLRDLLLLARRKRLQ